MVEEPSERVMALATVAQAAHQAGQRIDLLNQAKEAAAEAETDSLDRARVLTALVRIAAAEGSEEVADLLEQAGQTAAAIDDPNARVWTLTVAVRVAADAERTEKVVELLAQASHAATGVKDPIEQASARTNIALAGAAHLAAAGRRDEVAELLAQASHAAAALLEDPIERPYILATLAQVAIAGQVEQASELLARAEHAAATIEEPVQRARALAAVAEAAGSRIEQTTELFIQATKIAGAIEDPSQRVEALGDIAGAAVNVARLEDALLAAETADTVLDHASGWTRSILVRARVGPPPGGWTPRMRGCPHGTGTQTAAPTDPSRVHQGVQARRGRVGPGHFSRPLPAVTLSNENGSSRSRRCLHPPPAASGGHEPATSRR